MANNKQLKIDSSIWHLMSEEGLFYCTNNIVSRDYYWSQNHCPDSRKKKTVIEPEFFDWKFDERDFGLLRIRSNKWWHNIQTFWTKGWKIAFVIVYFLEFQYPFKSTLLRWRTTCIVFRTLTIKNWNRSSYTHMGISSSNLIKHKIWKKNGTAWIHTLYAGKLDVSWCLINFSLK